MFLRVTILILLGFWSNLLFSQDDNKPLPPNLNFLTINPLTGAPTLKWTAPTPSISNPNPLGYIVYKRFVDQYGNNDLFEYGNVDPTTFEFEDISTDASLAPVSYTVASKGPTEPSAQTVEHYTINLTVKYDSCQNRLDIKWTHYVGWGNDIMEYRVYLGNNLNLASYTRISTLPGAQNALLHPIQPNGTFYFYVEAIKNGVEGFASTSNLVQVSTKVSVKPRYIYIDKIIGHDNQNEIKFTIDDLTEYNNFSIIRWPYPDSLSSAPNAKTITTFTDPSTNSYSDTQDTWETRSKRYFYRINAYDGCDRLKRVSSFTNSMVLRAFPDDMNIHIEWSKFLVSNPHNLLRYRLYRIAYKPEPTPPELIYTALNSTDSTFVDNVSGLQGKGYLPKFCYYIEAIENLMYVGRLKTSQSRLVCVDIQPEIIMPNAIDPLSIVVYMKVPRNVFAPRMNFESTYKLLIYNRNGGLVYQGLNSGWNGRMPNGDLAREGAYIYRLEVTMESGRVITKTGSVTVMYGPQ